MAFEDAIALTAPSAKRGRTSVRWALNASAGRGGQALRGGERQFLLV